MKTTLSPAPKLGDSCMFGSGLTSAHPQAHPPPRDRKRAMRQDCLHWRR